MRSSKASPAGQSILVCFPSIVLAVLPRRGREAAPWSSFDEELTYGEARKKAEELAAKDDAKTFWPEMIMDPNF